MKNLLKNWKTTLAAAIGASSAIVPVILPQYAPITAKLFEIAVILGLVAAKDGDKTGL